MSVHAAVERDLAELRMRSVALAESALAATALALGAEMDDPQNSATSKSMCARALAETLKELRVLAPAKRESDDLDDLTARRDARLAARGATA